LISNVTSDRASNEYIGITDFLIGENTTTVIPQHMYSNFNENYEPNVVSYMFEDQLYTFGVLSQPKNSYDSLTKLNAPLQSNTIEPSNNVQNGFDKILFNEQTGDVALNFYQDLGQKICYKISEEHLLVYESCFRWMHMKNLIQESQPCRAVTI
jgi:hypothetical protein